MWRLGLAAALLVCLGPGWAQDKPAPNVLFLHGAVSSTVPGTDSIFVLRSFLPDERLQDVLAGEKIAWSASLFSTRMTWDYLKQFNVIVLLDFPMIEKHEDQRAEVRATEQLLARFVSEGGGLLAMGTTEAGMWGLERNTEELNRFLAPYDATVLTEQVEENDKALTLSCTMGALGWTGGVVPHEVTKDVRGLLYPLDYAWAYYTHPLKVGADWQVVLKGSPSAGSHTSTLGIAGATGGLVGKKPGTYKTEAPLVAVRQAGAGRLALWPTTPSAYVIDGYHQFWGGGLTMEGNQPDKPSNGRQLLVNLVRWLGQPSAGKLGGVAVSPPAATMGDEPGFQTVEWDAVKLEGKPIPNTYRGLIGLQSNLSGGQATPEQMIAAAREAGYDFVGFTEDLAGLTAEKFASLRALCQQASTDKFQVFPGYAYRDQSGNLWSTFGRALDWPKAEWFVPGQPGRIVKNNFIFRGFQFMPLILTDAGHNPEPVWYQGNFKGMAVLTLQGDKVTDDATAAYQGLQARGFDLFPVVVNRVSSVAEVQAAARAPWQTYVRWWDLPDVTSAVAGNVAMRQGSYVFHRSSFVSGGPLLEDFRVYNFGSADLAIPGNDRYRIRLSLKSPAGLREVALYDGTELCRRVLLAGDKEWAGEFDCYQNRTRHYIVRATDTAGRGLVSNCGWTDIQDIHQVRCTDNINTYWHGKHLAVKFCAPRGLESYIDRQAGGMTFFPYCWLPETERPAVDQQLPSVSRFGVITDNVVQDCYPQTASANWNHNDQPELAAPNPLWRGTTRQTLFTPWADSTSVYLVEGDYEVLRDQDVPQGKIAVFRTPWLKQAEVACVAPRRGGGYCKVLSDREPYLTGSFAEAEYVAQLAPPGGSRALIPLQEGLGYEFIRNRDGLSYLGGYVALPGNKLVKGQKLTYRYLAVWDTVNGRPDNSFAEEVMAGLGLRGQPGYQVTPTRGKVLDTQFILRLQADGYGFAGTLSRAHLPLNVPVMLAGLNPRWAAGLQYKGQNALQVPVWKTDRVGNRFAERTVVSGADQLLRFPVNGTAGMLQVDVEAGARDIYAGNLLVCERPEVFLELEDSRPGKAVILANNPLDEAVTVTIKPGPGFTLLGDFSKTVTLPPGGVARVRL